MHLRKKVERRQESLTPTLDAATKPAIPQAIKSEFGSRLFILSQTHQLYYKPAHFLIYN